MAYKEKIYINKKRLLFANSVEDLKRLYVESFKDGVEYACAIKQKVYSVCSLIEIINFSKFLRKYSDCISFFDVLKTQVSRFFKHPPQTY